MTSWYYLSLETCVQTTDCDRPTTLDMDMKDVAQ